MSQIPVSQKKIDGGKIKGAQPCANTVEIRVVGTASNSKQQSITVHGFFSGASPVSQALADTLWTSISTAWNSNLAPQMVPAATIQAVHIRDMTIPTNPVFIGTGTALAGTGAPPAVAPENAVVLTENVTMRGRGLKGRMYLGGWANTADAGNGVISSAASTAASGFGTALFNAITGAGLTPCVAQVPRQQYQGLTGTVHAARTQGHPPVSNYTLRNNEWDTQRRRGLNG
jgi:hypothetical protein